MNGPPEPANMVRAAPRVVLDDTRNAPTGTGERWLALVLRAGLVLIALLTLTSLGAAQESRVLLVYPEVPSPLLGEALVHVRGELGSLGLSLQVTTTAAEEQDVKPELLPGTYGALVFEERPGLLIVRAYHPESSEPISQQLPTQDGRITPLVAGVRAVETLRAALQQYYQSTSHPVPDPVKKLARVEQAPPPPAPPPPVPPPPVPPPPVPSPPPASPEPRSVFGVDLWLAPTLQVDALNARSAAAGSLGLALGQHWWSAGIELTSTVIPFELRAESGSAEIDRHAAGVELGSRLRLADTVGLFANLGGGAVVYRVQGVAASGYTANEENHWTAFGAVGVGADVWFTSRFGLFLEAKASAALDAPYVRFSGIAGERFERPLLSFAVGVMLGLVR